MNLKRRYVALGAVVLGAALGVAAAPSEAPPAGSQGELIRLMQEQRAELRQLRDEVRALRAERGVARSLGEPGDVSAWRAEMAQMTRALQEELSAARGAACEEVPPEAEPSPRSPESATALAGANQLVERALQSRQWGDREVHELRRMLPELTDADRTEVMRRLVVAINNGALAVATHGPPL